MPTYEIKKARKAGPGRLLTEKDVKRRAHMRPMPVDPYGFLVPARGGDHHNVYASPALRRRSEQLFARAFPAQKDYASAYGVGFDSAYFVTNEDTKPFNKTPENPDRKTDVGMWQSRNSVENRGLKFKIWAKAYDAGRKDGRALKLMHLNYRKTGKFTTADVSSIIKDNTMIADDGEVTLTASIEAVFHADGAPYFSVGAFDEARDRVMPQKSRETLILMSPSDFLKMAYNLKEPDEGKTQRVASAQGVFRDLPRLIFTNNGNGTATVIGHEGRHRMYFLKDKGVKRVPVLFISQPGAGPAIRWGAAVGFDVVDPWPTRLKGEENANVIPFPVSEIYPRSTSPSLLASLQNIYHYTSPESLSSILKTGRIRLSANLGTASDKGKAPFFLSLTRSKVGGYHTRTVGPTGVLLDLNYDYLRSRYNIEPRDYWGPEFRKANQEMNEMEETLVSQKQFIMLPTPVSKLLNGAYILLDKKEDGADGLSATIRNLLITLKAAKVPVFVYDNAAAWRSMRPEKALKGDALTSRLGGKTREYSTFKRRNWFAAYLELAHKPVTSVLSKDAERLRQRIKYAYGDEDKRQLENDLHNNRRDDTVGPITQLIKKAGGTRAFLDGINKKYKDYKVTASDIDYSDYGYWITDKGEFIPVENEEHAKTAYLWLKKHDAKTFDDLKGEDNRVYDYQAFDTLMDRGWVHVTNGRHSCQIIFIRNGVTDDGLKAVKKYFDGSGVESITVIAQSRAERPLHKLFTDEKQALDFIKKNNTQSLTALIEAAEQEITAADMTFKRIGTEKGRDFSGAWVLDTYDVTFGEEKVQLAVKRYPKSYTAKVNIFGNSTNKFGPANIRALIAFIKKTYKNVYSIYGDRISGARKKSGKLLNTAHIQIRKDNTVTATDREKHYGKSLFEQGKKDYLVIYRAVPKTVTEFKPGDYVTLSKKFATEHADHVEAMGDPAHVIKMVADPREVYDAHNPGEYFYGGKQKRGRVFYVASDHLEAAETLQDKFGYPLYWVKKGKKVVFEDKGWHRLGDRLMDAFEKRHKGFEEYRGAYETGFKYGYRNPVPYTFADIDRTEAKLFTQARKDDLENEGYDPAEYAEIFFQGVQDGVKIGEYHKDYVEKGVWDKYEPSQTNITLKGQDAMRSDLLASLQERMLVIQADAEQSYTNKTKSVKALYYANRSTPQLCKPGQTVKAKAGYGKRVKIRSLTEDEIKQVKAGKWIRTRADGKNPNEKGSKKSSYRPWLHASIERRLEAAGLL